MNQIRLVIADDHELVRLGLKTLIESNSDMRVVSEAGTAEEALSSVEKYRPDVIILDIRLPDRNGLGVCREIKERFTETRVIILTTYIQEEFVTEALTSGASGFVLKEAGNEKLILAIRTAMKGETTLDSKSASHLVKRFRDLESQLEGMAFKDLSSREMDVLRIVADGKSNKEIGAQLKLRENTIRNYVSTILAKLGLTNRIELALYAVKHKLSFYAHKDERS